MAKKFQYKLKINLNNSKDLAYLLGAVAGDGYVCYNCECGRIYFKSIDKILVEEVKINMKNIGLNPGRIYEIKFSNKKLKTQYSVCALSTEFYRFYKSLDLYEFVDNLNDEEALEFLRGLYETEGSAQIIHKNSVVLAMVINTEDRIIDNFVKILDRFNISYRFSIDKRIYGNGNNCTSILMNGTSEEKVKFLQKLNPVIKNIKEVNGKYIIMRSKYNGRKCVIRGKK